MNENEALSQEEIDALLTGTEEALVETPSFATGKAKSTGFKETELSNIIQLLEVLLTNQVNAFQDRYNHQMLFSSTKAHLKDVQTIKNELKGKLLQIYLDYEGGIEAESTLLIPADDALKMAEIVMNQKGVDFSESTINSISEAIVQMNSASNRVLSSRLGKPVQNKNLQVEILEDSSKIRFPAEEQMIDLSFNYNPENTSPIAVHQLMSVHLAKILINIANMTDKDTGVLGEDFTKKIEGEEDEEGRKQTVLIRPVVYQGLEENFESVDDEQSNITLLMDIYMQLTVELGRTKMQIKDILALGEGSIIELEKLAGEPVDLLVNGKLIARGEVVVIDENFGVRVTEIVSPHERLESIS